MKIGVIDSGVGGLTVLRALRVAMPGATFLYYGDTARAPYGGRPVDELLHFGREIITFLLAQGADAIVLACGTLSSTAYDTLREDFAVPIFDVLRPGVAAVQASGAQRIGFIATAATVRSGFFVRLLQEHCPDKHVAARACPLFAPMVEKGWFDGGVVRWAVAHYLADWHTDRDALVLGCTHYPMLATAINAILPEVRIIDLSEGCARQVQAALAPTEGMGGVEYFVSGNRAQFDELAKRIVECAHGI